MCAFAAPSLQLCMRPAPCTLVRVWSVHPTSTTRAQSGERSSRYLAVYAEQFDADLLRDPSAGHPPALPPPRDTLALHRPHPCTVALTFVL